MSKDPTRSQTLEKGRAILREMMDERGLKARDAKLV
jgi:hypothetical protein